MMSWKKFPAVAVPLIIIIPALLLWGSCKPSTPSVETDNSTTGSVDSGTAVLPVSSVYRIEEPGAAYTGAGVAGIIDGKEYLFLDVNTQDTGLSVSSGILVLDISDRTNPGEIAFIATGNNTGYIRNPVLHGTVLYASVGGYLWAVDVSDPENPRELSKTEGLATNQMVVSGDYAFTTLGNFGINTLDLSDPGRPVEAGYLHLQTPSGIQMLLHKGVLFTKYNTGLSIIDASVPTELKILNEIKFRVSLDENEPDVITDFFTMRMIIEGDAAYMALAAEQKLALSVLDISEPAQPKETDFIKLTDGVFRGPVFIIGEKLFIFTAPDAGAETRLSIIDLSVPETPVETGFIALPDARSFFENYYDGSHRAYGLYGGYLYWFIDNLPEPPAITILELPD